MRMKFIAICPEITYRTDYVIQGFHMFLSLRSDSDYRNRFDKIT